MDLFSGSTRSWLERFHGDDKHCSINDRLYNNGLIDGRRLIHRRCAAAGAAGSQESTFDDVTEDMSPSGLCHKCYGCRFRALVTLITNFIG